MCDAWNDSDSRVKDEDSFALPYTGSMQDDTVRFLSAYTYEGLDLILQQFRNEVDKAKTDDEKRRVVNIAQNFNTIMDRAVAVMKQLDTWNTQTTLLKRDTISASEYWNIVSLLEELIYIVDGDDEFTFVKLEVSSPDAEVRRNYNNIMNDMTNAFIKYREGVIKPLHTEIDNHRAAQLV